MQCAGYYGSRRSEATRRQRGGQCDPKDNNFFVWKWRELQKHGRSQIGRASAWALGAVLCCSRLFFLASARSGYRYGSKASPAAGDHPTTFSFAKVPKFAKAFLLTVADNGPYRYVSDQEPVFAMSDKEAIRTATEYDKNYDLPEGWALEVRDLVETGNNKEILEWAPNGADTTQKGGASAAAGGRLGRRSRRSPRLPCSPHLRRGPGRRRRNLWRRRLAGPTPVTAPR